MELSAKVKRRLFENWFLLGILFALIIAYNFPWIFGSDKSYLCPRITSKIAIFLIFLLSGLKMSPTVFVDSLKSSKMLISSLIFSFLVFPILGWVFTTFLKILDVSESYRNGFMIATCMPPPASAGIILTSHFEGDEAAAVIISLVGNSAATLISPLIILLFLGLIKKFSFSFLLSNIISLFFLIFFPIIIGMSLSVIPVVEKIKTYKIASSIIGKLLLLYVIICTLSPSISQNSKSTSGFFTLFCIGLSIMFIQLQVASLISYIDNKYKISRDSKSSIALVLSCSMKSLTTGVTLVALMSQYIENSFEVVIPILMFEPLQISFAVILGTYYFQYEEMKPFSIV